MEGGGVRHPETESQLTNQGNVNYIDKYINLNTDTTLNERLKR